MRKAKETMDALGARAKAVSDQAKAAEAKLREAVERGRDLAETLEIF